MKGIVFSLKRGVTYRYVKRSRSYRFAKFSIKRFLVFYGLQTFFLITFLLGVVLGSVSFKNATQEFIQKLDFLFLTNLKNRIDFTAFEIFCSSFASSFLFVLSAFLSAFTAWGMFTLVLLSAFLGYGVGISSTYIFFEHSVTGIGFYILVVLPGLVMFLIAFISALKEAFTQSILLLKMYFPSNNDVLILKQIKPFLFRYFVVIIFTALASFVDMLLWVLFANMFNF